MDKTSIRKIFALLAVFCLLSSLAFFSPVSADEEIEVPVHTVSFYHPDGSLLASAQVTEGLSLREASAQDPGAFRPLSGLRPQTMKGFIFQHWCRGSQSGPYYDVDQAVTSSFSLIALFKAVEEPAVEEPEAEEPEVKEPEAEEPEIEEPEAEEPAVEEPEVEEPEVEEPEVEEPEAEEPALEEPEVEEHTVEEPEVEEPEAEEPAVEEPEAEEPEVEEPEGEEPAVEEPEVEGPAVEEPVTEEPEVEEPEVEEPTVEEPEVEEPVVEDEEIYLDPEHSNNQELEAPAEQEPEVEEPEVAEPEVEDPVAEEPAVEDEDAADENPAENNPPASDEPVTTAKPVTIKEKVVDKPETTEQEVDEDLGVLIAEQIDELYPDRKIQIYLSWGDKAEVEFGDPLHFTAKMIGYGDLIYELRWQYLNNDGGEWQDLPGQTEDTLDLILDENTVLWSVRIQVDITDELP